MKLPWEYYASFWHWLRYGILIYWRCADCGKRHLSTLRGWSKHIGYNAPLCTPCENALDAQYNSHMAEQALRDEVRELRRQYDEAFEWRDWQTVELISDRLSHDSTLREAWDELCAEDDEEDEWVLN